MSGAVPNPRPSSRDRDGRRRAAGLDFCVGTLGLRLVKKTVNFDNHHVYHFYYGDERGTPGTILDDVSLHGRGVRGWRQGRGPGHRHVVFGARGIARFLGAAARARAASPSPASQRFGEEAIAFADPSGLHFELVAARTDDDARRGSAPAIGDDAAIRGLHSVTMDSARSRRRRSR